MDAPPCCRSGRQALWVAPCPAPDRCAAWPCAAELRCPPFLVCRRLRMAIRPHGLVQIGSHTLPVPGKGLRVLTRGEEAQHLLKMPVSARVPCRQEGEQPAQGEPDCPQQMPARLFFFRHFLSPAPARPGRQRCRVFRAPLSHFVTRHPSFLQGCYFFSLCVTTVRTPRLELAYFAKGALF